MASAQLYEVERIVDKRKTRKGKWEYLVRWKGYGRSEDTWEPQRHLQHCREFIHQFNSSSNLGKKQRKNLRTPGLRNGDVNVPRDSVSPHVPHEPTRLKDLDVGEAVLTQGLGHPLGDPVFDKRLRYSVRHAETNGRFRDIVVRKEEGFTHVLLSSQTSDCNALTPEMMKEVMRALSSATADDSKLLLLSAVGSVFCCGLETSYLIGRLMTDRRKESIRIAEAVRDFVKAFIQFRKPIVVAVNGPALGLGASILPLCDIVWASEKAWFQTPHARVCLTAAGCSSHTFPQVLGVALASDVLLCGRKLSAQEACSHGLVSQVFWPTTFSQEVFLRVKEMCACSAAVLEESKCLVRSFVSPVLEEVNEKECQMLKQWWSSTRGLDLLCSSQQERTYQH